MWRRPQPHQPSNEAKYAPKAFCIWPRKPRTPSWRRIHVSLAPSARPAYTEVNVRIVSCLVCTQQPLYTVTLLRASVIMVLVWNAIMRDISATRKHSLCLLLFTLALAPYSGDDVRVSLCLVLEGSRNLSCHFSGLPALIPHCLHLHPGVSHKFSVTK